MREILLAFSTVSLVSSLIGILKLIYDIFTRGYNEMRLQLPLQFFIVAVAFILGWVLSLIGVRKYNHLVIPLLINFYSWGILLATCALYGFIIHRLFEQNYTLEKYVIFWLLLLIGCGIVIALQLIPEETALLPFALPLLLMSLGHLITIIYHYIFIGATAMDYIAADMLLFMAMLGMSLLFISEMPFLNGLRRRLGRFWSKERMLEELKNDRR